MGNLNLTLIISIFILLAGCSNDQSPFEQAVLLETPSGRIVSTDTKEPYTGLITTKPNAETQFYGEVLNGWRQGLCFWMTPDGDTIELKIFESGDMVYSYQFRGEGKRSDADAWKKFKPDITQRDSLLIDRVFMLIKKEDYFSISKLMQGKVSSIDHAEIIKNQITNYIKLNGQIKNIQLLEIKKSAYNFRPENYLEFLGSVQFQRKSSKFGFRILELENEVESLEIWEVNTPSKIRYEELGLWAFLNMKSALFTPNEGF